MANKNTTAYSMTSDLIKSAFGQPPVEQPAAQDLVDRPDPLPANSLPVTAPAPVVQAPPVQAAPKPFDAASVSARFTQPPPEQVAPVTDSVLEAAKAPEAGQPPEKKEGYAWAKLRTEAKAAETAAAKYQTEAAQAREEAKRASEEKAQLAAELETRKQRELELVEKVGRLSLAESPDFQQKYDLRMAEVQTKLSKALVKFAGTDEKDAAAQARQIMESDPKKLPDILSDLNPGVAGMILGYTSEAAAIDEARTQELSNWRQTGAAASVGEARRSVVEQAESRRKMSAEAVEAAKALGNPVYTAEDPRVREVAAAIEQEFHGFVQTATEEQLIRAASEGYTAPYLYDVLNQQQAEITELKNLLAGRTRAANPPLFASPAFAQPQPAQAAPPPNVIPASTGDTARDFATQSAADTLRQFAAFNR